MVELHSSPDLHTSIHCIDDTWTRLLLSNKVKVIIKTIAQVSQGDFSAPDALSGRGPRKWILLFDINFLGGELGES